MAERFKDAGVEMPAEWLDSAGTVEKRRVAEPPDGGAGECEG